MKKKIFLLTLSIILIWQAEAHAYINPGSGSEFFQIIMSIVAGIIANIKKLFGFKSKQKDEEKYE